MKALTIVVLVLSAFSPHAQAAAPNDDASKQDLHAMQGTWTVVSSEQNGEKRTDLDAVKKMRLTIKGDQWTLEYHNNVNDQHAATIKLDPSQKPKAVDFRFTNGLLSGETSPAIYELQGDRLKFCFPDESKQRPKNFNSSEGPGGRWLLVLKRERK